MLGHALTKRFIHSFVPLAVGTCSIGSFFLLGSFFWIGSCSDWLLFWRSWLLPQGWAMAQILPPKPQQFTPASHDCAVFFLLIGSFFWIGSVCWIIDWLTFGIGSLFWIGSLFGLAHQRNGLAHMSECPCALLRRQNTSQSSFSH